MNELHRQAYLDAMGVDVYFPRVLLPGAPESELCEMPEGQLLDPAASLPGQGVEPAAASGAASEGRAAAMQALLGEIPGAEVAKSPAPPIENRAAVAPVVSHDSSAATPRFTLSVMRIANLLVIDDAAPEGAQEFQRLQHNVWFALGLSSGVETNHFKWPIVESSHLDQSEFAARQTLQAFVQNQSKQGESVAVILMGDTAARYLLEAPSVKGEWLEHFIADLPVLCVPSLVTVLGDGEAKNQLWQALKPLRKKLAQ